MKHCGQYANDVIPKDRNSKNETKNQKSNEFDKIIPVEDSAV
jgi:hypothetical protein